MKSAIQGVVLLACITICTSQSVVRCRCIKSMSVVRLSLVMDVRVYEPHPACHKREVIAVMKDKSERCLDPESSFTKRLLQVMAIHVEKNPLPTLPGLPNSSLLP
ncbi:growth-regulated alpha protein-like [Poeciliopsis prolifica]|uniref:growth-regulated alpha protein-like n=1 Tax=Poeciliopsis prolifica TaxID=188132 RepID=UPI0024144354|nr:growth-regulated alpha protein-like [Poeciliopsis prolifica]